jgi:hypothetical protein
MACNSSGLSVLFPHQAKVSCDSDAVAWTDTNVNLPCCLFTDLSSFNLYDNTSNSCFLPSLEN